MKDITINGREFALEFEHASQGHRFTAMEWDGDTWQTLPDYNGVLCLMSTHFETLCGFASDVLGDSVYAEDIALAMEIPFAFYDDEEEYA